MAPSDAFSASLHAIRAELIRRQDAAQDAGWHAQFAGDDEIILALQLARWWDRLQSEPLPPVSLSAEDLQCAIEAAEEMARSLFAIAQSVERAERRRADVAAGIERRPRPPTRVRMPDALGREPRSKANGDGKQSRKLTRTEQHLLKLEEEARSRHAMRAALPPQMETLIKIGRVETYNSRDMSGVVSFMMPEGRVELPFDASATMRSGLTSLSPGQQELECVIKRRPDGAMLVEEIKLSVGARAAAIAERERQAEAAEANYRLTLGRRLH